jgi:hypothetical protein
MLFTTSLDVYSTRPMHLVQFTTIIITNLAWNECPLLAIRHILL